jgi:heme A synthase
MPLPQMENRIANQALRRGNSSSGVAAKWLVYFHRILAGTIIFYIALNPITII